MGTFWFQAVPYRLLRLTFIVKVQANGLSALVAFSLTAGEIQKLDGRMTKYMRAMMQGDATDWTQVHPVTMGDAKVWKHWRLPPTAIELRCQRIRWLQNTSRYPEEHAQMLAIVFGHIRFEIDPDDPNACHT